MRWQLSSVARMSVFGGVTSVLKFVTAPFGCWDRKRSYKTLSYQGKLHAGLALTDDVNGGFIRERVFEISS